MRRGVLGGTFDPPHIGHLVAAEAAYDQLGLDEVVFMPAGAPWQKAARDITDGDLRMEMVAAAVADVPHFGVDGLELHRDGPSYTIDTLEALSDDDLVLIVGADAAAGVPTWHRAADVLATAGFAVMRRHGTTEVTVGDALGDGDWAWLDVPRLEVSSSDVRDRVASGRSVRFLVPDPVRAIIERDGLYAD